MASFRGLNENRVIGKVHARTPDHDGDLIVLRPMGRIDNDTSPAFQTKLLSSVTSAGAAVLVEEKLGSPATYREKNSILGTPRRREAQPANPARSGT